MSDVVEGELVSSKEEPAQPLPVLFRHRRVGMRMENITVEAVQKFFEYLEQTGALYHSAHSAGLSYVTINRLRKEDETFKEFVDEAMTVYRETLEKEAHRRAIDGWDEPVFSHKTGEMMGVIRKYDSKLLELLLKRHIPEFRDKFEGSITISGGVLIAPVAAPSPEDFDKRFGKMEYQPHENSPKGLPPPAASGNMEPGESGGTGNG